MNSTNRALNRLVIAVAGLLALVVGIALAGLATVPAIRDWYHQVAPPLQDNLSGWWRPLPLLETGTSWYWVFALVLLALVVGLFLWFIFRQGHGRQNTLLREQPTSASTTIIDAVVAEKAIQNALEHQPAIIASSVSTYQVHGTPVLKISAICRRGVSPREMTTTIEHILTAFDHTLGQEIPVFIQLSGGFRARHSRSTRTV